MKRLRVCPGTGPTGGFPNKSIHEENIGDMKLIVDGVIANGINYIVYHIMPYHRKYYASIHVQRDCAFNNCLLNLNKYIAKLCEFMRKGESYHCLAIYLQFEDNIVKRRLQSDECTPGVDKY